MADEMRMKAAAPSEIGVNFPFTVTLEHPTIGLHSMFEVTQSFDMYEMEHDKTNHEGLVKENILVDVLECTPTQTIIKVTPAMTMPYAQILRHTESMLSHLSRKLFSGKAKVIKLVWEVDKTGVASDLRGMLRKIN